MTMRVVQYSRKRRPAGNFSIESIFDDVRRRLAPELLIRERIAPCQSNGLLRRMWIALDAWWYQGTVTHVTGDINFATILLNRKHTILTSHDCSFLGRSHGIKHRVLRFFWVELPTRRVTLITTVSQAAKNELLSYANGCSESKVVVIPNAISSAFSIANKTFSRPPRLLQVGTAVNKNLDRSIEALRGLDCTLAVIGKLSTELSQKCSDYNIRLETFQDLSLEEVVDQYRKCDIVLFPSTIEGFGMPILEGQATGRPVVTSNLSSMPEVAGEAACLVDPFDVNSIRDGIRRVIQDDEYRQQLVEKGLENVKRFDPQCIAQQYLDLYRKVAHRS